MGSSRLRLSRALIGAVMVALAGSGAPAQPASSAPPESPLTLEQAVARALAANRTFAAARARRAVDEGAIAVARQRPNPEITFENERETPRVGIGGSLPIEVAGKRGRR